LRQRWTTQSGKIGAQNIYIAIPVEVVAAIARRQFIRARRGQKPQICRGNFDPVCHSSVLAATVPLPVPVSAVYRCCPHSIQDVIQATRMLPYIGGRTNTMAALRLLRDVIFRPENGDRVSARNVAVLIANGESTLYADQVLTHVTWMMPAVREF